MVSHCLWPWVKNPFEVWGQNHHLGGDFHHIFGGDFQLQHFWGRWTAFYQAGFPTKFEVVCCLSKLLATSLTERPQPGLRSTGITAQKMTWPFFRSMKLFLLTQIYLCLYNTMQQIRVGFMVCICVEDVTYGIFSIAIPPLVGVLALLFGAKRARANSYQLNPYLQRLWRIFVLMHIAHLCILKIESSNTSLCESLHGNLNWWIYVSTDTWKPPWGKTLHLIQFAFIYLQFPQVLGCSVTARAEQEAGWCRLYKYSIQMEFSLWFCCYSRLASKWYNMYVYIYICMYVNIYIDM